MVANVSGSYLDGEGLHQQLAGVAGTMASSEPYTPETFRMFPDLQVIARLGVGYDAVDLEAARDHEVPVMIAAGTNHTTVAESAVALLLALARNLGRYFETTAAGSWARPQTTELRGKTIGVIGLGRIGKSVVRRLQGFEVDVVAAEPYPGLCVRRGIRRGVAGRGCGFSSLRLRDAAHADDGRNSPHRQRMHAGADAAGIVPGQHGAGRAG